VPKYHVKNMMETFHNNSQNLQPSLNDKFMGKTHAQDIKSISKRFASYAQSLVKE